MRDKLCVSCIAGILLVFTTGIVQAAPILFYNSDNFLLAGSSSINFDLTPAQGDSGEFLYDYVSFWPIQGTVLNIDQSKLTMTPTVLGSSFTIDFYDTVNDRDRDVSAFGFNWERTNKAWVIELYNYSNNEGHLLSTIAFDQYQKSGFFGFADDTVTISYAILYNIGPGFEGNSDQFFLDDFRYVSPSVSPVPEPTTLFFIGAGLMGIALVRKKPQK